MIDIWAPGSQSIISASHTNLHSFSCHTKVWIFCSLFRGVPLHYLTFFGILLFIVESFFFCLWAAWVAIVLFNSLDMLVFFRRFFVFFFFFFFCITGKVVLQIFFFSHTRYHPGQCACITWLWVWTFGAFDSYQLMFGEDFSSFFFFVNFCPWTIIWTGKEGRRRLHTRQIVYVVKGYSGVVFRVLFCSWSRVLILQFVSTLPLLCAFTMSSNGINGLQKIFQRSDMVEHVRTLSLHCSFSAK